jgi:hypothetical protein
MAAAAQFGRRLRYVAILSAALGGKWSRLIILGWAYKLASTSSERAVIAVLAPVCADKFRALPDVAARTATLIADKGNSYKMREAFPEAHVVRSVIYGNLCKWH